MNAKGVNFPELATRLPAMTDKGIASDAAAALAAGVDFLALSFVRQAADLHWLRRLIDAAGTGTAIVAKIEKPQALENLDGILAATDAIMVARGDLGVEVDIERIGVLQKQIIGRRRQAQIPVIVATQMLESMTEQPCPTWAEATVDVTNAILDGTDAVMLGETALGRYPMETVRTMATIAAETERYSARCRICWPVWIRSRPVTIRSPPSPAPPTTPAATYTPRPSPCTHSQGEPPAHCPASGPIARSSPATPILPPGGGCPRIRSSSGQDSNVAHQRPFDGAGGKLGETQFPAGTAGPFRDPLRTGAVCGRHQHAAHRHHPLPSPGSPVVRPTLNRDGASGAPGLAGDSGCVFGQDLLADTFRMKIFGRTLSSVRNRPSLHCLLPVLLSIACLPAYTPTRPCEGVEGVNIFLVDNSRSVPCIDAKVERAHRSFAN